MNKRILITRPQSQNAALINALQDQGHTPIAFPLLKITPFNEVEHHQACQKIKQVLERFADYQHCIFISTNAVESAMFWLGNLPLEIPRNGHNQIYYAIGDATAEKMNSYFTNVEQSGKTMNSEALLEHKKLQNIAGENVLIFRGVGGRDYLKQELTRRGAKVEYCEVYQRVPIKYPFGEFKRLFDQGITLLTATSEESIQLLLEHANNDGIKEDIQKLPFVVSGKRLCQIALERGFKKVVTAENAGINAMLNACNEK